MAYITTYPNKTLEVDLEGESKLLLYPDDDTSHSVAFNLYLAVTDYLIQEGYFDPDGLDSSGERYRLIDALLNNPLSDSI